MARRILDFNNDVSDSKAYRIISDVMTLSRVPFLAIIIKEDYPYPCEIHFLTFDKGLREFANVYISESEATHQALAQGRGELVVRPPVKKEWFLDASEEDWQRFAGLIGQKYTIPF